MHLDPRFRLAGWGGGFPNLGSAIYPLCDLEKGAQTLCALVSPFIHYE